MRSFHGKNVIIEHDVDETGVIYIVLKGIVDAKLHHNNLNVDSDLARIKAGEVFGDD